MIKTGEFSHVAVNISDIQRSKEFYEKVIGLKTIKRPNLNFPGEWYAVGNNQLHLIGAKRRSGIDPTGPHMAIEVDDFEAVKKALSEAGIPFLDGTAAMRNTKLSPEDQKRLGRQLWVQDPDGNVVELRKSGV
jgi:catechol 2,3-dioxygenase-like lactoylglutathione lyase family enzyme